jgi:hypothetical protein
MRSLTLERPCHAPDSCGSYPSVVGLGPELPLKLHEAPDPGASARTDGSTLATNLQTVARSTPSSWAHRSSGAAIGRPTSRSCQIPSAQRIEHKFDAGNQPSVTVPLTVAA